MPVFELLDSLQSRGSLSGKAGSLGALHAHRLVTLSQFFTPKWVVDHIWTLIAPAFKEGEKYSLCDTSVGAASMFRNATPEQFELYGIDIDGELLGSVIKAFESTSFKTHFVHASIADVRLEKFSVSMINPAFSIQLSSQSLQPYKGITHFGVLGADTSALSHEYALAQALAHSDIVVALIPSSATKKLLNGEYECIDRNRIRAVLHLPSDAFMTETVSNFKTDVIIFSKSINAERPKHFYDSIIVEADINQDSVPKPLKYLNCQPISALPRNGTMIKQLLIKASDPTITTPITGDNRVILRRAGRKIKLKFFDGATEVKVLNRILEQKLVSTNKHRYPKDSRFAGQYKLSLDVITMQEDPFKTLDHLCELISAFGGEPIIDNQLRVGLASIIKEHIIKTTPFSRTVYRKGLPCLSGIAKRTHLINRTDRNSVVTKDTSVSAVRNNNGFALTTAKGCFDCPSEQFFDNFIVSEDAVSSGYWEEIQPPMKELFPTEFAAIEKRANELGLRDLLSMEYQFTDLCELAFAGSAICGWQMALGKTRLEIALAMLMKGTSLIVLKSRLIDEMMIELDYVGIERERVNVITDVRSALSLTKLNIVSYETLRRSVDSKRCPDFTYAHLLKNKIDNLFVDEGGCLSNPHTQQSKALYRLNVKNRYILDGTPCPNYPREMLALLHFITNGPKSYMPYSNDSNGIHYYASLFNSALFQPTGRKEFLDKFATFEWTTNEFFDTGVGAKREVPKVKQQNLNEFRSLVSSFLKRRVQQEPAIKKYIDFPVPTLHPPISIEWDFNHLVQYVNVLEDFAAWYTEYCEKMSEDKKACSLVVVLARLEACYKACNVPSSLNYEIATPFNELTSKERACIDLVVSEVGKGRRPIVFAKNPVVLHRLASELNDIGISSLVFTGEENIKQRTERLNTEIRNGDAQVMLASIGVTQDGLNLHQLNTFIFYSRSYMSRVEFQAIYRLIRPKQTNSVYGYFLHLEGSIDEYMGQLIDWKQTASEAGLDYAEQPSDRDFKHFESFIHSFLESLPALKEKISLQRQKNRAA